MQEGFTPASKLELFRPAALPATRRAAALTSRRTTPPAFQRRLALPSGQPPSATGAPAAPAASRLCRSLAGPRDTRGPCGSPSRPTRPRPRRRRPPRRWRVSGDGGGRAAGGASVLAAPRCYSPLAGGRSARRRRLLPPPGGSSCCRWERAGREAALSRLHRAEPIRAGSGRAVPGRVGVLPGAGLDPRLAPGVPPLPRFFSQPRLLPQRGVGAPSLVLGGLSRCAPGPSFRRQPPAVPSGVAWRTAAASRSLLVASVGKSPSPSDTAAWGWSVSCDVGPLGAA